MNRFILPGQMTLINQAVLTQCVGRDGGAGTDPFLTDPRDCHFDPKALVCSGGKVPPACLTADQVTTMQKYYAGTIDPVNGQVINPGSERGNETEDVTALGLAFQERLPEPAFDGLFYWVFGPSFGYPAGAHTFANFDFHHDVDTVDDQLAAVLNADSADLSEFREHGGKLIMYHGWADQQISPFASVEFYQQILAQQGQVKTDSFLRMFMLPGIYHCAGGPGAGNFGAAGPAARDRKSVV